MEISNDMVIDYMEISDFIKDIKGEDSIIEIFKIFFDKKSNSIYNVTKLVSSLIRDVVIIDNIKERTYYQCNINGLWPLRNKFDNQYSIDNGMWSLKNTFEKLIHDVLLFFIDFSLEEEEELLEKKELNKPRRDLLCLKHMISKVSFIHALCIEVIADLFDEKLLNKINNRDFLSVENGIINLKTGILRRRKRTDYCTFKSSVKYDAGIDITCINEYLHDLMIDETSIEYLQTLCGYILTGHVDKGKKVFVFQGNGNNGKTLFVKCLREILGEYSYNVLKINSHCWYLNTHYWDSSCRLLSYDEGNILDYIDFIETKKFRDNFKVIFMTNEVVDKRYHCSDNAEGLIVIRFPIIFTSNPTKKYERMINLEFFDKISTEKFKSAFLRWCVIGAMKWYQKGLEIEPSIFCIRN